MKMELLAWSLGLITGLAVVSQLRHCYVDRRARQRRELRERIGRHTGLDARAAVAEAERIIGRAG